MKKMMGLFMAVGLSAISAFGDGLIPAIKVGDGKLQFSGFGQASLTDNVDQLVKDSANWTNLRLRSTLTVGRWEFGSNFNFADLQAENGNWLRELYAGYKLDEHWQLSVGRIFLAAGYSTPAPFEQETVNAVMSDPFSAYGYGANLLGKYDKWTIRLSLSGNSGLAFSDRRNFEQIEFAGRVERKFADNSFVGLTAQLAQDKQRYGLNFSWKPENDLGFYTRVGLAYTDYASIKTSNRFGAYVFAAIRPAQLHFLELHSQVDSIGDLQKNYWEWQSSKDKAGNVNIERKQFFTSDKQSAVWTNGIRLFAGKNDAFSLTADYEKKIYGEAKDRFLIRGQIKF